MTRQEAETIYVLRLSNALMKLFATALLVLSALLLFHFAHWNASLRLASGAPARNAVLVELFTSEGCSSCPPADTLLGNLRQDLAGHGFQVIPLGFHVDYWNSLGWRDRFSSAAFSHRQEQYAQALHIDGPYTPQLVIDGATELVGIDRARAHAAIAEAATRGLEAEIDLSQSAPEKLELKVTSKMNGAAVMLAITEDNLSTRIGAGENNGRELHHAAVVRELRQLGIIQNGSLTTSATLAPEKDWKPADLRAIIFVQQAGAGKILGAASVPLHGQQR